MTNLQECLSYLSDIDFDRETLKAAREELAYVTQRANGLPADVVSDASWNAALEAAAKEAKAVMNTHPHRLYSAAVKSVAEAVERIRALKREAK